MWRMIQNFTDEEITIDKNNKVRPIRINGIDHLIFKEYQLKYCQCIDKKGETQEYWGGQAEYECGRNLQEKEEQRKPNSRTYLCKQSRYIITILKNNPSENQEHKKEYMGNLEIFED